VSHDNSLFSRVTHRLFLIYRSNRTGTYKEESKLNLETFGQANPTGQNRKRHQHRNSRGRGRPQQRNGRNKPVFNQSTQLESS
jgi:hypothetical protein